MAAESIDAKPPEADDITKEEETFLKTLNEKIRQVLDQVAIQCQGLEPVYRNLSETNGKPAMERPGKRTPQDAKNLTPILAELCQQQWGFARSSSSIDSFKKYVDPLLQAIVKSKEQTTQAEIQNLPITSAKDALILRKGLKIMQESEHPGSKLMQKKDYMPGQNLHPEDTISSWEEVLEFSDGFLVEGKLPNNGNGAWRGLLKKIDDGFFLDLKFFGEAADEKEKILRLFTYRPPQTDKESYVTRRIGGLEYGDYREGYMLSVSIPPTKTAT